VRFGSTKCINSSLDSSLTGNPAVFTQHERARDGEETPKAKETDTHTRETPAMVESLPIKTDTLRLNLHIFIHFLEVIHKSHSLVFVVPAEPYTADLIRKNSSCKISLYRNQAESVFING